MADILQIALPDGTIYDLKDSTALPLTGGTLTGNLIINNNNKPNLSIKNPDINIKGSSVSAREYSVVYFQDTNNLYSGYIGSSQETNGDIALRLYCRHRNTNDTANIDNTLILTSSADGTKTVDVSDPAAWRTALGAVNVEGDTITGRLVSTYAAPSSGTGAIVISHGTSSKESFFIAERTDKTIKVGFGVGGGGTSHGVYSWGYYTNNAFTSDPKWIVYRKDDGDIVLNGNAATATKLATARSLKVKLDSTTAITFDGSADQNEIPVTGTLSVANGGTGGSDWINACSNLHYVMGNGTFNYGVCTTAAATATKTVVCDYQQLDADDNPLIGQMILVKFTKTNSAATSSLKLKVGSGNAKNIKYYTNNSVNNIPAVGYLAEGCTYLFYYDGTYWVVLMNRNNTYTAASATPLQDELTGAVGTSSLYARQDHIHPVRTASLWTGTWSTGKITVTGLSNYNLFKVRVANSSTHDAHATCILAMFGGNSDTYFRGVGGYASTASTYIDYYLSATRSGNQLTFQYCYTVSGGITTLEVTEIIGLI